MIRTQALSSYNITKISTPSYYPPGWDKERWQSATDEEFTTLTEEDFEKFHTGIREDLSEDELEDFFDEMDRRQAAVRAAASSTLVGRERVPNFITVLNQHRADDGEFLEWGFVVFRTTGYGRDRTVRDVKEKIEASIDNQFLASGASADVRRAKEKFRLIWIEEESLESANTQEISRKFRELVLPIGVAQSICLCVDVWSLKSIQQAPLGIAHMLAVSNTCGLEATGDEAEDERWTGSFKLAISSLITELYPVVGDNALLPFEVGVGVTDDQVWTDTSREGRQKATIV
ncbi:Hypothetical protein R9X50_00188300 [Acrodontium crateriforme]|uniref:Uncharacterized protein n=1 Tax=Acrodontium crateriforme TaxID=150365 RepID=A0AAQ3M087_9PEZI|nr:Hypothetical protein R9X50_00188300 [Acrodontium crateriforme]